MLAPLVADEGDCSADWPAGQHRARAALSSITALDLLEKERRRFSDSGLRETRRLGLTLLAFHANDRRAMRGGQGGTFEYE
jgi:hypothetical protein